jgi:hypothetical protein
MTIRLTEEFYIFVKKNHYDIVDYFFTVHTYRVRICVHDRAALKYSIK